MRMDLNPLSAVVRFIRKSGKRIAVTVVGFLLLAAGGVMLVTPGPGVIVILAGLAVLASEWAWAERALDKAKQRTGQTIQAATASPLRIAISVIVTLGGIAAVLVWFFVIR